MYTRFGVQYLSIYIPGAMLLDYDDDSASKESNSAGGSNMASSPEHLHNSAPVQEVTRDIVKPHPANNAQRNMSLTSELELRNELKDYLNSKLKEILDA